MDYIVVLREFNWFEVIKILYSLYLYDPEALGQWNTRIHKEQITAAAAVAAVAAAEAVAAVVVDISLFFNNVRSKITKFKFHNHMYTWIIPDVTLLAVAREAEARRAGNHKLIELATVTRNIMAIKQCNTKQFVNFMRYTASKALRHGVSNYRSIECLFRLTTTKQHRSRLLCLCGGNPPVTGGFRAQEESYAEMFPFDDIIIENVNEQRTEFLAELRMLQRMESLPEYKFFETGLLPSGGQAVFNIYIWTNAYYDFHTAMSSNIIYNAIQVTFVLHHNKFDIITFSLVLIMFVYVIIYVSRNMITPYLFTSFPVSNSALFFLTTLLFSFYIDVVFARFLLLIYICSYIWLPFTQLRPNCEWDLKYVCIYITILYI